MGLDGGGQLQGGGRGGGKRGGRGRRRAVGEEREGLAESAAADVHDQVDRAAATLAAGVIEELGAADAQQRPEPLGERLEGGVADAVGVLAQVAPPGGGRAGHGRISWQAPWTCSVVTVRALSRAAAARE